MAIASVLAINKPSYTFQYDIKYILLISIVAGLGGLLFGYDLVVISGAIPFFSKYFNLSVVQQGQAVGCINLGAALGALFAGRLSTILGRRKLLILCAV